MVASCSCRGESSVIVKRRKLAMHSGFLGVGFTYPMVQAAWWARKHAVHGIPTLRQIKTGSQLPIVLILQTWD